MLVMYFYNITHSGPSNVRVSCRERKPCFLSGSGSEPLGWSPEPGGHEACAAGAGVAPGLLGHLRSLLRLLWDPQGGRRFQSQQPTWGSTFKDLPSSWESHPVHLSSFLLGEVVFTFFHDNTLLTLRTTDSKFFSPRLLFYQGVGKSLVIETQSGQWDGQSVR